MPIGTQPHNVVRPVPVQPCSVRLMSTMKHFPRCDSRVRPSASESPQLEQFAVPTLYSKYLTLDSPTRVSNGSTCLLAIVHRALNSKQTVASGPFTEPMLGHRPSPQRYIQRGKKLASARLSRFLDHDKQNYVEALALMRKVCFATLLLHEFDRSSTTRRVAPEQYECGSAHSILYKYSNAEQNRIQYSSQSCASARSHPRLNRSHALETRLPTTSSRVSSKCVGGNETPRSLCGAPWPHDCGPAFEL